MNTRTGMAVTAIAAAVALAACGGGSGGQGGSSTSGSSTQGSSSSTSPASPGASSSTSVAPTSSSAPSSAPAGSSSSGTAATHAGSIRTCTTTHLEVALARTGAAAGSVYDTVRLTNTGTATCTLYGYPGVSLVGHGNGTQIGAAARRDHGFTPRTVTVRPGASTTFIVQVTQAANYPPSDCSPTPADGLRIYPPGNTAAL